MPDTPKSIQMLSAVMGRLRLASIGQAWYVWTLAFAVIGALLVLASRFTAALPSWTTDWRVLASVPALAIIPALLLHKRTDQVTAAREVDRYAKTKDLFLTLSAISTSAGAYQPLVAGAAESLADKIAPAEVIQYTFGRRLGVLASSAAVIALMVLTIPQFDPFGKVEAAVKEQELREEIIAIKKATQTRKDRLLKEREIAEAEDMVDLRIDELKRTFRDMKPRAKDINARKLEERRKALNEQWKQTSSEQLREMLSKSNSDQQFGGSRTAKMNQWLKELQDGNAEGLKQELRQAQSAMQAMLNANTPEERQAAADELRRELQDLKRFASDKAGSKELESALNQALKSLEAASQRKGGKPGEKGLPSELDEEAFEALKESLDLAKLELEDVERSAEDLKKLEEALETLQMAERLNQERKDGLESSLEDEGQTMEDYKEFYEKMMADAGETGEGMGDAGFGEGGEAEEDDSTKSDFKEEKEKTQVQAGKVLFSIKTKDYAEGDDIDPEDLQKYRASVQAVKANYQAAIEAEQIPPGYEDGISGYFDDLDETAPAVPSKSPGDTPSP